ncbi:hypothetical protein [Methylorubrum populi]
MKTAHRLEVYAQRGPWGLTKLYEFVKRGMLPARKIDGTTFVLESDWDRFLEDAPLAIKVRRPRVAITAVSAAA